MYLFVSRARNTLARLRRHLFSRRISYSQYGEDLIIEAYFPSSLGTYLDVGSGRPKRHSNSFLFYRRGWNGVCVDANPLNTFLHKIARPRDKALNLALDRSPGPPMKFFIFKPWQLSTLSKDWSDQLIKSGARLVKTREVQVASLPSLGISTAPGAPFFLSIDVEGLDFEVISGIDWSELKPSLICIEELDRAGIAGATQTLLEQQGYFLAARTPVSSIYVHKQFRTDPLL